MPPPEIELGKTVIEGILLKLGDIILMAAPGLAKKGFAVTVVMMVKRKKSKHGPNKKDRQPPRTR